MGASTRELGIQASIERQDAWELTIKCGGKAHAFLFTEPPLLYDFLRVCKRLPWTGVWDETLIPFLKWMVDEPTVERKPNWPYIRPGHKAAHAAAKGPLGLVELEVRRQEVRQQRARYPGDYVHPVCLPGN